MSCMFAVFTLLNETFCFPSCPSNAALKKTALVMREARHSFVPPIKDVTAASQGVNSKWGSALPSAVRSRNDLDFSCFLSPFCVLLPLSSSTSVSLSLRQACRAVLCWRGVLTWMQPEGCWHVSGPHRRLAACDGTRDPHLCHRNTRCEQIKKRKALKSVREPLFLHY